MNGYVMVLEHHGFIALIVIVLLTVTTPALKQWVENTRYFKRRVDKVYHLAQHSFFSQIGYWRNIGIDAIQINDKGRSLISKDLLHIQFRVFETAMRNIIHYKQVGTLSQLALKQHITAEITQALKTCEMESRQIGIPDVVRIKFIQWHQRSISFLMNGIDDICSSSFYKNNPQRLNALLTIMLAAFHATLLDAERTLDELNGELTGITYKNITIED